jgi:FkbM family methyltransferase
MERQGDLVTQQLVKGSIPDEDEQIVELVLKLARPGGVVLDLGAHLGAISLSVAAAKYQVIAVEASSENAASLEASVSRNRLDQMQVVWAAVSDHSGTLEFLEEGPFGHVAASELTGDNRLASTKVPAVTIDELLSEKGVERVDFIKMDVEGSEVAAVRGMKRLLSRADAPPIVYESNGYALGLFGTDTRHLRRSLEKFGYRNYHINGRVLRPVRANDIQTDVVANYLAIKEPPADFRGWSFADPPTKFETIQGLLSLCAGVDKIWGYREHLKAELAGPPNWLLSHRGVRKTLRSLQIEIDQDFGFGFCWWLKYYLTHWLGRVRRRIQRLITRTR